MNWMSCIRDNYTSSTYDTQCMVHVCVCHKHSTRFVSFPLLLRIVISTHMHVPKHTNFFLSLPSAAITIVEYCYHCLFRCMKQRQAAYQFSVNCSFEMMVLRAAIVIVVLACSDILLTAVSVFSFFFNAYVAQSEYTKMNFVYDHFLHIGNYRKRFYVKWKLN